MKEHTFYRDTDKNVKATWRVLETLGLKSVASDDDVAILRYLVSAVSVRAAQIVGASELRSIGKSSFADRFAMPSWSY